LNWLKGAIFEGYSPTITKNNTHNQAQQADAAFFTTIRTTKKGGSITNTLQSISNTSAIGPILDKG